MSHEAEKTAWSRRHLLQLGAATVAAAGLPASALPAAALNPQTDPAPHPDAKPSTAPHTASMIGVPYTRRDPRIGFIGTGGRGTNLLQNLLAADAHIVAVCDVVPEHAQRAVGLITKAGQPAPTLYTAGDRAFESLVTQKDLDFVVIATPWVWHEPMAVAAMHAGKDVAVEVPAVRTLDECWSLVRTSESTRRHCTMLENCCYGYNETLILRMTHAGVLGDLLYGEGAYLHDLRDELFSTTGEGLWRRREHTLRDGNLYPTHGLGPVANYLGIERGDRFDHLVSISSPHLGLEAFRAAHLQARAPHSDNQAPPGGNQDPRLAERYVTGDMNVSLIRTARGRLVTVKHTVSTPRPYSRINSIAGTRGIFEDYPARLFLDGQNTNDAWSDLKDQKHFEYPLWTREGELARKLGGHGGMDFIMLVRLLQCLREGLPPDMDVYDAASWSAVAGLSVRSVAQGSAPQPFPDFTRGHWQQRSSSPIATLV